MILSFPLLTVVWIAAMWNMYPIPDEYPQEYNTLTELLEDI